MKRLAAATLAAAAVVVLALGPSSTAAGPAKKLELVEVATFEKLVVDTPPRQRSKDQPLSPGDVVVGRAKLLRGNETVGTAEFFGVVTAFPRIEFYGTFTLPGGTVSTVAVGNFTAPNQTYAIVGGTGRYTGARGTIHEQRIAEGKTLDEFTITT